jgi:hypothetical protein
MVTRLPIQKHNVTKILSDPLTKTTDAHSVCSVNNLTESGTIRETGEIREASTGISLSNYN